MDAAKWSQGFQDHTNLMKPMEDIVSNSCNPPPMSEKKPKPPEQLNCPRCNSTNTKFCYYNNYSLTQPRYFCKACRRYWTAGGSLRNVPVGGGSRRNKRSSTNKVPDLNPQLVPPHNPKDLNSRKGQDLNLAFPMHEGSHGNLPHFLQNSSSSTSSSFDLMGTNGMVSTGGGGFSSFVAGPVPESSAMFSSGFPMQDYKAPTLSFSIDGFGNRSGAPTTNAGVHENEGRIFFPFGEMKNNSNEGDQIKEQGNSSGYWNNGVLGGGSWQ